MAQESPALAQTIHFIPYLLHICITCHSPVEQSAQTLPGMTDRDNGWGQCTKTLDEGHEQGLQKRGTDDDGGQWMVDDGQGQWTSLHKLDDSLGNIIIFPNLMTLIQSILNVYGRSCVWRASRCNSPTITHFLFARPFPHTLHMFFVQTFP